MSFNLIDEWKQGWRFLSVQANSIGTAISLGYASMYDQLKDNFPPAYMAGVTGAIFVLGIIGRLVKQEDKK